MLVDPASTRLVAGSLTPTQLAKHYPTLRDNLWAKANTFNVKDYGETLYFVPRPETKERGVPQPQYEEVTPVSHACVSHAFLTKNSVL